MQKMMLVVALVLLMQVCEPILAQTPTGLGSESEPGILQRVSDRYRNGVARVQGIGGTVLGYAGAYYEDHIKPVTDPYINWVSSFSRSLYDRVQQFQSD
ncbi:apolipoprotein C-IV [Osmerus mordax]|uniref:apolipoprotein C-IV n=1 Tax=Osmerus mordax TaxID=8014 RepID=UPI0035109AF3